MAEDAVALWSRARPRCRPMWPGAGHAPARGLLPLHGNDITPRRSDLAWLRLGVRARYDFSGSKSCVASRTKGGAEDVAFVLPRVGSAPGIRSGRLRGHVRDSLAEPSRHRARLRAGRAALPGTKQTIPFRGGPGAPRWQEADLQRKTVVAATESYPLTCVSRRAHWALIEGGGVLGITCFALTRSGSSCTSTRLRRARRSRRTDLLRCRVGQTFFGRIAPLRGMCSR